MNDIDAYNRDAERLEKAMNDGARCFRWRVRRWGPEFELEKFGWNGDKGDKGDKGGEGAREAALRSLDVLAITKREYWGRRVQIEQFVSRELMDCVDDFAAIVNAMTRKELQAFIQEYAQERVEGAGTSEPVGILKASQLNT